MTKREKFLKAIANKYTREVNGVRQNIYTDHTGKEYYECRGAYNSDLTKGIMKDIRDLALFGTGNINGESIMAVMLRIITDMSALDDNLCRMIDDREGFRKVIDFDFKKEADLVVLITEITKQIENKTISFTHDKKVAELIAITVSRLIYIMKFASNILHDEDLDSLKTEAECQMFECKEDGTPGEQIDGLSDKDRDEVLRLIDISRTASCQYLMADPFSEEEKKWEKLSEVCHLLAQVIIEGKVEELEKELGLG